MQRDPDGKRIAGDDRDDDRGGGIEVEAETEYDQLHHGRQEHRPRGFVDASGGVDAGVQDAHGQVDREFDDDQERVDPGDGIGVRVVED